MIWDEGQRRKIFFLNTSHFTFLPVSVPNAGTLFYFLSFFATLFFPFSCFFLALEVQNDEYLKKAITLGVERLIQFSFIFYVKDWPKAT